MTYNQSIKALWQEKKEEAIKSALSKLERYVCDIPLDEFLRTLRQAERADPSKKGKSRACRTGRKEDLTESDVDEFCSWFAKMLDERTYMKILGSQGRSGYVRNILGPSRLNKLMEENYPEGISKAKSRKAFMNAAKKAGILADIQNAFKNDLDPGHIRNLLIKGRQYSLLTKRSVAWNRRRQEISEKYLHDAPENYADFFPEARARQRRFFIHVGPTNSGKTYEAMEACMRAEYGIYLAPLRLLAYEQYERMTDRGIACAMITGEERITPEAYTHQSSTIEVAPLEKPWDVAVIDEAQMAADPVRGGAWTNAILGICADEVHVCCSPDAEAVVLRMVASCNDIARVIYHERKTPLVLETEPFRSLRDIEKGDAVIVFSRKDVHAVAAELRKGGVKCSVIYGALPYDVRHREAERFASGRTQVVVATDAIGMGMNLPIRRVVFLAAEKFDGKKHRTLYSYEIKQIAGRAGRFGLYDTVYVNSYGNKEIIREGLEKKETAIDKAVIGVPELLFENDEDISEVLRIWAGLPATSEYDKVDIKEKQKVAADLERYGKNRDLVRRFIRFPIEMSDSEVYILFVRYYNDCFNGDEPDVAKDIEIYKRRLDYAKNDMRSLEGLYCVFDFLFNYTHAFCGDTEEVRSIMETKRSISEMISDLIEKQAFIGRKCSVCGKPLSWKYAYGICHKCHAARRAGSY